MRLALLLAVGAACYSPRVPAGAPCDRASPCPREQQCIAGQCEVGGGLTPPDGLLFGDAAIIGADAPDGMITATDRDGDGIEDAVDNCPDVPNADQGNEDGDSTGDACDPCPIDATPGEPDGDGDGLPDACDPNPTTAGDALVMFEGFHHGLPGGWAVFGTVTQMGDDVELASAGNEGGMMPPITPPANGQIVTKVVLESLVAMTYAGIGVSTSFDPNAVQGVACELYSAMSTNQTTHDTSLFDYTHSLELSHGALSWQTGVTYTLSFTRSGSSYGCSATPDAQAAVKISGHADAAPASPKAMIESFNSTARISWLMVVSSP